MPEQPRSLSPMRFKCAVVGCVCLLASCGGNASTNAEPTNARGTSGGSAGSSAGTGSLSGSGGGSSSSGGSSSGASGGAVATGGQGTGGLGTGGAEDCSVDSDCVAVVDKSSACGCNEPQVVPASLVTENGCLVPYWDRFRSPSAGCGEEPVTCPPVACEPLPQCVFPRCDGGACVIDVPLSPDECEERCGVLDEQRRSAFDAAVACDPTLNSISCDASALVRDECNCPRVVNERNPELVQAAQAAFDAWLQASCGATVICPAIVCVAPQEGSCGPASRCKAL